MKDIEVNEYVRLARNQGINKIIDIYDKKYELETDIANEWGEFTCILEEYQLKDEIINHSKQLIDLIECGDFVNGYKVISVDYDVMNDTTECIELDLNSNYQYNFISIRQIQTILTKEQYMANCYKVGGEDE